ncbi:MAG TPA: type II toxin-antitoxin system HigB family toxin [Dyadobacter sp.]|nr:type II toxin-antitoxin system HigB family toxin [Dyadobacter sp.]
MVVISKTTIHEYIAFEPRARDALLNWYKHVKTADWSKFSDIRKSFNSVDSVGNDRYVFNIKGNDYRLVASIHFEVRTVYVVFIGTHSEYDKIEASRVEYKE